MTQDPGTHGTGGHPDDDPPLPPVPGYGTPAPPVYGTPAPPVYGTPAPPVYGTPAPPGYNPPSGYGQLPDHYGQPGYDPPPAGYGAPVRPGAALSPAEEKQWSMFAHFGGAVGIIPALIIYLVFKDRGPFVRNQTQEALNFQITALIGYVALMVLSFMIRVPLQYLLWIPVVVLSIIGGLAANRGETYRYPYSLRLLT